VIFPNHTPQLFKICPLVAALQGLDPLGRNPERVGNCHPNAPRAHVQPKDSPRSATAGGTVRGLTRGLLPCPELGIFVAGVHGAIIDAAASRWQDSGHRGIIQPGTWTRHKCNHNKHLANQPAAAGGSLHSLLSAPHGSNLVVSIDFALPRKSLTPSLGA
jgi:hypothetical protein